MMSHILACRMLGRTGNGWPHSVQW